MGAGGAMVLGVRVGERSIDDGRLQVGISFEAPELREGFVWLGLVDEAGHDVVGARSPLLHLGDGAGEVSCELEPLLRNGLYFPVVAISSRWDRSRPLATGSADRLRAQRQRDAHGGRRGDDPVSMDLGGNHGGGTVTGRWPDFIIIGAMKSATSSLYAAPDTAEVLPGPAQGSELLLVRPHVGQRAGLVHEPVRRRRSWGPPGRGVGELHVPGGFRTSECTDGRPVPRARLIYVVRQPVERLRSHYRHEVQRSRERRPLIEAISAEGNPYVETSRYFACLRPYIDRFPRIRSRSSDSRTSSRTARGHGTTSSASWSSPMYRPLGPHTT